MGYNHFRYARRIDADKIGLYHEDLTRLLQINKATANTTIIEGQGVTGDNMVIKANVIDTYPFITLDGNSGLDLDLANNSALYVKEGGSVFIQFSEDGNGCHFKSSKTGVDLFLETTGTGVVKFGTHTGTGDAVSNGYIATKDSSGNAIKLMTTA